LLIGIGLNWIGTVGLSLYQCCSKLCILLPLHGGRVTPARPPFFFVDTLPSGGVALCNRLPFAVTLSCTKGERRIPLVFRSL